MSNRIQEAIDRVSVKLADIDSVKLAELSAKLDMTFAEHARFQEEKSLAFISSDLTLDEANLLYSLLGGSVTVFNRQSVAVKIVLTQTFKVLLENR